MKSLSELLIEQLAKRMAIDPKTAALVINDAMLELKKQNALVPCVHTTLNVVICKDANDAARKGYDYAAGEEFNPITLDKVVVVQNGTKEGRSSVDFVMRAGDGQKYVFMLTGRLLKTIPC